MCFESKDSESFALCSICGIGLRPDGGLGESWGRHQCANSPGAQCASVRYDFDHFPSRSCRSTVHTQHYNHSHRTPTRSKCVLDIPPVSLTTLMKQDIDQSHTDSEVVTHVSGLGVHSAYCNWKPPLILQIEPDCLGIMRGGCSPEPGLYVCGDGNWFSMCWNSTPSLWPRVSTPPPAVALTLLVC